MLPAGRSLIPSGETSQLAPNMSAVTATPVPAATGSRIQRCAKPARSRRSDSLLITGISAVQSSTNALTRGPIGTSKGGDMSGAVVSLSAKMARITAHRPQGSPVHFPARAVTISTTDSLTPTPTSPAKASARTFVGASPSRRRRRFVRANITSRFSSAIYRRRISSTKASNASERSDPCSNGTPGGVCSRSGSELVSTSGSPRTASESAVCALPWACGVLVTSHLRAVSAVRVATVRQFEH